MDRVEDPEIPLTVRAGASGSPVVVEVRGLLDPPQTEALRLAVLASEARFVDASIGGAREDWRIGSLVYDPPEAALLVAERVRALALRAATALEVPLRAVERVECQLTAYRDGGYYKLHTDSRGPDVARRALSWVHYLVGRSPKGFEGGELHVTDRDAPDDPPVVVVPEDGMTVIFASLLDHEVKPVRVPSGAYEDSRFTVNGWIWR